MIKLVAPEQITLGVPFDVEFESDQRASGRLRLTAGTNNIHFTLEREGKEPAHGESPRIRGKKGTFRISAWGMHTVGTELVLRFEGAKAWMTVQA